MLKKEKVYYTSIIILIMIYLTMLLISYFTKDTTKKEIIVGINLVSLVQSVKKYDEPLTITLEEKTKEETEEKDDIQEVIEEEKSLEKAEETSKEAEDIKVDTNVVLEEIVGNQTEEVTEQIAIPEQYQGFTTVGKIEIPKTGVDLPILNKVTVEGMKIAPCLLYQTGEINQSGNTLIVGHNFRDNTLFSNNNKLNLGDKIYITTLDAKTIEYTICDKFITTPEDVSYIKRDTNNCPEIKLSCCTDDDINRIVILAKT